MNEPKPPIVYFQIKKLKEIWERNTSSNAETKKAHIDAFNESLKEIEREYLLDLDLEV